MKMAVLFLINALHFHHDQDDHHNVHEKSPCGDVTKYDNNDKKDYLSVNLLIFWLLSKGQRCSCEMFMMTIMSMIMIIIMVMIIIMMMTFCLLSSRQSRSLELLIALVSRQC